MATLARIGHILLVVWEVLSFVLREIVGWALVFFGVALIGFCLSLVLEGQIMQAGLLTFPAIILFRGGIHLLKVSVAARLALQARDRVKTES